MYISVTEYNSMIDFNESRAILPPEDKKSWKMWDKVSRYQVKANNFYCLYARAGVGRLLEVPLGAKNGGGYQAA